MTEVRLPVGGDEDWEAVRCRRRPPALPNAADFDIADRLTILQGVDRKPRRGCRAIMADPDAVRLPAAIGPNAKGDLATTVGDFLELRCR